MDVIYSNNKFRVATYKCGVYEDIPTYIFSFKVQIKILFFWITIKEFRELEYHTNPKICKRDAIELYNNITGYYGKF